MIIKDLAAEDLHKGFFDTLAGLTDVGFDATNPHDLIQATAVLQTRITHGILTYIAIINDRVVGTVSLVPEIKFIHGGSLIYRLEDVAVHEQYRGRHIGLALLDHAIAQATNHHAYKILLNCYDHLISYYQQRGFHKHDNCLRLDLPHEQTKSGQTEFRPHLLHTHQNQMPRHTSR